MKLGRNPDVEASLVGFLRLLPGRPADLDVIRDGLAERFLELVDGAALEGDKVIDAFDPAVEAIVFRAEMNRRQEILILKNILHGIMPCDLNSPSRSAN